MAELPYFCCTLGDAQNPDVSQPFRDVNHLINTQSKDFPDLPAIGLFTIEEHLFKSNRLSFSQLDQSISAVAVVLRERLPTANKEIVALLGSSSPQFLLTWLACIRLGHAVLLVAPQCSPEGIRHLCNETTASTLLVDDKHSELAKKAAESSSNGDHSSITVERIPFAADDVISYARNGSRSELVEPLASESADIAYFHHTSGTSSGVPKSIPQSHQGAVGALPALNGESQATFTTTPLYHGGPADIFRAWTSRAMIWLFPSHEASITASNVIRCLESAQDTADKGLSPYVAYFTSVPYVVQMMRDDEAGLSWLKGMDLVGVGGAALPSRLGDDLVEQGVKLVSRFGSAECGFLLSSHREYKVDEDWQYLRLSPSSLHLRFEPREAGLSELVVLPGWPHMAKQNREDGSFATSDLFEPHSRIKNAWRYHSRADAQLTLVTGKKFDPVLLESALADSSPYVSDVLVFGNDRSYPGALVFRSREAARMSDEEVMHSLDTALSKINARSEPHTRITSSMLIPMPFGQDPLPKSSKGTIIRKAAEERHRRHIEAAYREEVVEGEECSDEEMPNIVAKIVSDVLALDSELAQDMDFFALGVDSLSAMRIRHQLRGLLPRNAPRLPVSIVEDAGDVKHLSEYILSVKQGNDAVESNGNLNDHDLMKQLVDEYGTFEVSPQLAVSTKVTMEEVIVLTGATGALGTHVLDQLRRQPRVSKILCLVRGTDAHAAQGRVSKALEQRQMQPLRSSSDTAEVVVLQSALRDRDLGLTKERYDQVAGEATVIMHLAWSVNFRMKLQSFAKDSISSVQNLINLALAAPESRCPRFVFCSSVASVMAFSGSVVPETLIDDPTSATDLGYSQSKWVAEHVCHQASQLPQLKGKISIFRVGQLSGDSKTGIWNSKEAWPLLLSSVKLTGALPDLKNQKLDWLPLDVAASAMIEGSLKLDGKSQGLAVYHLLNDRASTDWSNLLEWAEKLSSFDIEQPLEWIKKLEHEAEAGSQHPALQLIDHWRKAYLDSETSEGELRAPEFSAALSKDALPSLASVQPVDGEYFAKLWRWVQGSM